MPDTDLNKLDPSFRAKLEELLRRLNKQNHDAILHEGWRSFERAAELDKTGVGKARSMHCYGLAADVISKSKKWDAPSEFWLALGATARILGMIWGGDWKKRDKDHVQAVRVSDQPFVRNSSQDRVAALVKRRLG